MVREALGNATPRERKRAKREKWKLAAVIPWIDSILETDQKAPRRQQHTAHRIWSRMKEERPEADVAESTVREYVRQRKVELGWEQGEVFVPQSYRWGQEGQVDWYEAYAEFRVGLDAFSAGERERMRESADELLFSARAGWP